MDEAGRVFFHQDRIFRAVYSQESADFCSEILEKEWMNDAFEAGLVKTWICKDFTIDGALLTLEHVKIPFATHPAESSSYMHWLSAKSMIQTNIVLSRHGYLLKDAHPWNLMFDRGYPKFIDFGSIIKTNYIPGGWLDEFRKYFGISLWLASKKRGGLALEYRRQHANGFGLRLFEAWFIKSILFRSLMKLDKYLSDPALFFSKLLEWVEQHKPATCEQETWANYPQYEVSKNPLNPQSAKQKFVYKVLSEQKPLKVLDFASNKGYYSEMAARLGASVIATDYEEYCVDECLNLSRTKKLDITPVVLDFRFPTPPTGYGLLYGSAYDRFKSDIVLALGLGHHVCITQRLPVQVFCKICMNYAEEGVIFEYIDPSDFHVTKWGKPIPADYSLEAFRSYFSEKFRNVIFSPKITDNGLCRTITFFYR